MTSILGVGLIGLVAAIAAGILAFVPLQLAQSRPPFEQQLVVESELLKGLGAGALYPFIDSTPNRILEAHIAITDSTTDCAGGADPSNMAILVGEAGVALESVMSGTNSATGIGTNAHCVYHLTVHPGETLADGTVVPSKITDIVVANGPAAPLGGDNTVTVSATVSP